MPLKDPWVSRHLHGMNSLPDDAAARLRHSLNRGAAPELSSELITGAAGHAAPRMTNPTRRLQVAGGTTVAIAALAVAALVITPSLQRTEPLFTAATGAATSALSSSEAGSSDMRIGYWAQYEYTAGAGLSTSGGSGNVYQLARTGTAEARTAEIAAVFGVAGTAAETEYSDPAYPTWVVGTLDGTAPSVTVTWAGTGDWWFNDPTANPIYECRPTQSDSVEQICPQAESTASAAPSEGEARILAHELFASTGFDVAPDQIEVLADQWQTTATAYLVLDGVKTALSWGVGWSNTGAMSWANGHSITVENRGSYGTVSASGAVDRLADSRWFGAAGPDYQGGAIAFADDVARSSDATSEPSTGEGDGTGVDAEPSPGVEPPVEPTVEPGTAPDPGADPSATPDPIATTEPAPLPEEPSVEVTEEPFVPEIIEVTVDEAESTLLLMWDSAGNAWLVPGFAMPMPEGWWTSVVSLVDGVIELPEPVTVEPYLLED